MARPVTLPLSFKDCFASTEGLARLHSKLDSNLEENASLLTYFKAKAVSARGTSQDLFNALPQPDSTQKSWDYDAGASTERAVTALFRETHQQAQLYRKVSSNLETKLIEPFENWVNDHKDRILQARKTLNAEYIQPLERGLNDVRKHRNTYEGKCIKLEEEEDEARHHGGSDTRSPQGSLPNSPVPTNGVPGPAKTVLSALSIPEKQASPHSPKAIMSPAQDSAEAEDTGNSSLQELEQQDNLHTGLKRKPTVMDRLKALARDPKNPQPATFDPVQEEADEKEEKPAKDEGPKIIELAGLSNGTREWSSLFRQAHKDLPKRSLKIPIVGVYSDVHSGSELVDYFTEQLIGLENDRIRTVEFLRQLCEDLLCLRLVGELGNEFRDSPDSFYQFKDDAFHLDTLHEPKPVLPPLPPSEPSSPALSSSAVMPAASAMLQRSNTILSSLTSSFTPASPGTRLMKARQEAEGASIAYKAVVKRVDLLRMTVDQQIELYLTFLQRASLDRIRFLKTTLARYSAIVEPIQSSSLSKAAEEARLLQEAMNPEQDVQSLCELYRVTNGYRPKAVVFQDHYNESLDTHFGVELSRWVEVHENQAGEVGVPDVLKVMLEYLKEGYNKIESPADRRRVWYLDVPLTASHRLRQALNDAKAPGGVPTNLLRQSDLPVVAATVKLYFLELDNPPLPYVQYEDLKQLYKDHEKIESDEKKIEALKELLLRVPKINLLVMDALAEHLEQLMQSTRGESVDNDAVYLTKLGLSVGRCLVRPKIDTPVTLTDRAPAHFLSDIVRLRDQILPSTIQARAQREKDRFTPKRKRTAPIDQRLSRSQLSGLDANEQHRLLEEQHQQKDPRRSSKVLDKNDLPPLPPAQAQNETTPQRKTTPPLPKVSQPPKAPIAAANAEDAPFVPPEDSSEDEPDSFVEAVSTPNVNNRSISPALPPKPIEAISAAKPPSPKPAEAIRQPEPISYMPPVSSRSSRVQHDAPFVPPNEGVDEPFSPPEETINEDVPLVAQASPALGRSGTAEKVNPLTRSGRVARGPRPISVGDSARIPTGKVAAAAQRFER